MAYIFMYIFIFNRITENIKVCEDKTSPCFQDELYAAYLKATNCQAKISSIRIFRICVKKLFPTARYVQRMHNGQRKGAYIGCSLISPSTTTSSLSLKEVFHGLSSEWNAIFTNDTILISLCSTSLYDNIPVNKDVCIKSGGEVVCTILNRCANLSAVGVSTTVSMSVSSVHGMLNAIHSMQVCHGYPSEKGHARQWTIQGNESYCQKATHGKRCYGLVSITVLKSRSCVVCNMFNPHCPSSRPKKPSIQNDRLEELENLLGLLGLPKDLSELLVEQTRNALQTQHHMRRWTPRYRAIYYHCTILYHSMPLINTCTIYMYRIFRI